MPPKSITKPTKTSRKRKIDDPTQLSLDFLLKRNVPMQIDSFDQPQPESSNKPATLGSFRKQLIVPKVTILNLDSPRPSELPASFYSQSWQIQKDIILSIFSKSTQHINYATAARLCENICRYGKAQDLYENLKTEIEKQAEKIKDSLSCVSEDELLEKVNDQWESLCRQLPIIRNVFMELDRYYILSQTKYPSIVQLGVDVFRDIVMSSFDFRDRIICQVLKLIQLDRDGENVDDRLIKDILYMMQELSFYSSDFESTFLEHTIAYYKTESDVLMKKLPMWEYIEHAFQRQQEEIGYRITRYLNVQTKQLLLHAVTDQLIYKNVASILSNGFEQMMAEKIHKPLSVFYFLLEGNANLLLLRTSFGEYIKAHGVKLIQNPKNDASMVNNLLDFKAELDRVLYECFHNDDLFANTLKESFEYFINTRKNKPAEMIGKFLDARLKSPSKKQSKSSEDDFDSTIDNVLVLFRYIQGKDAFEAYYKRYLAKRLLQDRSISLEVECEIVEKLKNQCGHEFTKNFETMLKDIQLSLELKQHFKQKNPYPISVKVATQAIWPVYSSTSLVLPPEMAKTQKAYSQFYSSRFKGKKLVWQNSLSSCILTAQFRKGPKELTMSLSQAVILLLFNDKAQRNVGEIKAATSLEEGELNRTLQSLCTTTCAILDKKSRTTGIQDTDVYQFNVDFNTPSLRLKVPAVQQEQNVEEKKEVESKVLINRQHQLEAAIVRIMKANKTMSQENLLSEIFKQLKFPVDVVDFKRRIESLIERDYILRDPLNNSVFVYQS